MADVRFLIIFGPPSLDPSTMGFPPREPLDPAVETRQRRPAVVGEPAGIATNGWYAWRLMASNNRRLASSANSFVSRPSAVDAIDRLRSDLAALRPLVLTDPSNGSWGWRAEHDGVPVATCPHWYERERDCRTGFGRFVDAAGRAQVADGGTILRNRDPGRERDRERDLGRRGSASAAAVTIPIDIGGSRQWPAN